MTHGRKKETNIRRFEIPTMNKIIEMYEKDKKELDFAIKMLKTDKMYSPYGGLHKIFLC